ncbi:MAG: hypothetical protein ABIS06_22460 [Vicinamibacterales bacterium]
MAKRTGGKAPWDSKNPKKAAGKKSTPLTPMQKAEAKARARAAGRPYPNLVDNMAVAGKRKSATGKAKKRRRP